MSKLSNKQIDHKSDESGKNFRIQHEHITLDNPKIDIINREWIFDYLPYFKTQHAIDHYGDKRCDAITLNGIKL